MSFGGKKPQTKTPAGFTTKELDRGSNTLKSAVQPKIGDSSSAMHTNRSDHGSKISSNKFGNSRGTSKSKWGEPITPQTAESIISGSKSTNNNKEWSRRSNSNSRALPAPSAKVPRNSSTSRNMPEIIPSKSGISSKYVSNLASEVKIEEVQTTQEQEMTSIDWLKETIKSLEQFQKEPNMTEVMIQNEITDSGDQAELAKELSKNLKPQFGKIPDLSDPKFQTTISLKLESLNNVGIDELQVIWGDATCKSVTIFCSDLTIQLENPLRPVKDGLFKGLLTTYSTPQETQSKVREKLFEDKPGWFIGSKFLHVSAATGKAANNQAKHTGQSDGWENLSVKYILDYNTLQMVVPKTEITLQSALTGKLDTLASFDFIFTLKGSISKLPGTVYGFNYYFIDDCRHPSNIACQCPSTKLILSVDKPRWKIYLESYNMVSGTYQFILETEKGDVLQKLDSSPQSKHMSQDGKLGFRDTSLCGWQLAEFQN